MRKYNVQNGTFFSTCLAESPMEACCAALEFTGDRALDEADFAVWPVGSGPLMSANVVFVDVIKAMKQAGWEFTDKKKKG